MTSPAQAIRDEIDFFHGPPLKILSDCLRGFFIASPGHKLLACDFSAIEARVIAWLSGEEKVLDVFRSHGKIYEHAASGIYRIRLEKITSEQRQIGKIAVLALCFGGGAKAFQLMAKNYGLDIEPQRAEQIKTAWREANPKIVRYWYDLERAAMRAVLHPGEKFFAGESCRQIVYLRKGSFLFCRLPSGRVLSYPYPKIEKVTTPWGAEKEAVTYMGESTGTKKWERQKAFGGLFAENVTQAVSRDLLAEAMIRLDEHGFSIILHAHDEIVCEEPKNGKTLGEMMHIMCENPPWAVGLPIQASGWIGERYRK